MPSAAPPIQRVPETKAVARSWSPAEWWADLRDDATVTFSGADLRALALEYKATQGAAVGFVPLATDILALRDQLLASLSKLADAEVSALYDLSRAGHDLVYDEMIARQEARKAKD